MTAPYNRSRLYTASCIALVVTATTFSIRANLMGTLGEAFHLSLSDMGAITAAAFWGFTIAMFAGGPLCDVLGLGRMYGLSFLGHAFGLLLTIFADGYWSLFISTLLIGIGNGFVESASYAMLSSMYPEQKAKKLNDWHIWFPAGIVIGGLLAFLLSVNNIGWKFHIALMLLPTFLYGFLFMGQSFPRSERRTLNISNATMIRSCFRPLFIFMLCCMAFTAVTELGTNQWIVEILAGIGVPSILLLVFINGLMVIGRMNAGFILKKVSTTGLLWLSAVFSFIGLILLSFTQGYLAFVSAGIFAIGICYFWPTMIGFVSERIPQSGPLGQSLLGGTGMLSVSFALPLLGSLYDNNITAAQTSPGMQVSNVQAKIIGGMETLRYVSILPAILIVAFAILHYTLKNRANKTSPVAALTPIKKMMICLLMVVVAMTMAGAKGMAQRGTQNTHSQNSRAENIYSWSSDSNHITLLKNRDTVWQFNCNKQQDKPYFHPLKTLGGHELTLERPSDHPWHRGLWFSLKDINGTNYWEEDPALGIAKGRTIITNVTSTLNEDYSAEIIVNITYQDSTTAVLSEVRRLSVSSPLQARDYHIDWEQQFTAQQPARLYLEKPIKHGGVFWGGYVGLSFRGSDDLHDISFMSSNGWTYNKDTTGYGTSAKWMDLQARINGDPTAYAGITVFEHPENTRFPSPWYIWYGAGKNIYFCSSFLYDAPLLLQPDEKFNLSYRVSIRDGITTFQKLQKQYKAFSTTHLSK